MIGRPRKLDQLTEAQFKTLDGLIELKQYSLREIADMFFNITGRKISKDVVEDRKRELQKEEAEMIAYERMKSLQEDQRRKEDFEKQMNEKEEAPSITKFPSGKFDYIPQNLPYPSDWYNVKKARIMRKLKGPRDL